MYGHNQFEVRSKFQSSLIFKKKTTRHIYKTVCFYCAFMLVEDGTSMYTISIKHLVAIFCVLYVFVQHFSAWGMI